MKSSLNFFSRKCLAVPMVFLVLILLAGLGAAKVQDVLPKDAPASASTQIDLPAADVVVLFDASLSMRNQRYSEVRQAVTDFTSALTGKEILHLRVFGDVAGAPLEGVASEISGKVADQLPADPIFHHTDLGAAIGKAIEFLERPGANEIQVLFLLTDGLHDPPPGSPFSRDFDADPDWQDLRQRALELCARRQVLIYGFGLGAKTDVSLLLKLFPAANVEVVTGNLSMLAATLHRIRENLRLTRLRNVIEQDSRTGSLEVLYSPNPVLGEAAQLGSMVTIRNAHRFLSVAVDGIELQRDSMLGGEIACGFESAPPRLLLAPGEQWQGRVRCGLRDAPTHWRIGRKERVAQSDWHLAFNAQFSSESGTVQLASKPAIPRVVASSLHVELRQQFGVPYWLIALPLLVISGLVIAKRRRSKLLTKQLAEVQQRQADRIRLSGTINVWPKEQPEPNDGGLDLNTYKTARLSLVVNADGALELTPLEAESANTIAQLSGQLSGASLHRADTGKVEFRLEAARGHRLTYEAGDEWREVSCLALCDRDLIEIDGRWRMRYVNHRLRTRAEIESAYV